MYFFYPREHRATVDDHFYPIRNSQLVDEKAWTWFPPRGQSRRPRQRGWGSSSPLHHSPSAPPNTTQDRLTPRYSEIVANRARLKLEQIQRIYLDNKPDTTCTIYSQYSQAHINASATAVTGSVFMRRIRLFLVQCTPNVQWNIFTGRIFSIAGIIFISSQSAKEEKKRLLTWFYICAFTEKINVKTSVVDSDP